MILSLAGLLATAGVAPGCDEISARSFGGNASTADGGAETPPDGGLVRGHGGTIAISVASGGVGGARSASGAGGAGGTPSIEPASGGGAAGSVPSVAPAAPSPGTGGALGSSPSGSGGAIATGGAATGGAATGGAATGGAATGGMSTSGSIATGGAPGSGGTVATGGQVGSGGAPPVSASGGAGSMPAPGPGSGGSVPPPAGSAGAGAPPPNQGGNAGGGDDGNQGGPDSCTKLSSDYDAAVTKGKSCDAKRKSGACAKAVPAKLSGCGAACSTYVDDDGMAKMIQQKWTMAGCVPESCALSLCINPTGGSCVVGSDDDKGMCSDTLLGL